MTQKRGLGRSIYIDRVRVQGKFAQRYDSPKKQRCIKVTDFAWQRLGELAQIHGTSRNDLIEQVARDQLFFKAVSLALISKYASNDYLESCELDELGNRAELSSLQHLILEFEKLAYKEFKIIIENAKAKGVDLNSIERLTNNEVTS